MSKFAQRGRRVLPSTGRTKGRRGEAGVGRRRRRLARCVLGRCRLRRSDVQRRAGIGEKLGLGCQFLVTLGLGGVVERLLVSSGRVEGGVAAALDFDVQGAAETSFGADQLAEAGLLEGVGRVLLEENGVSGAEAAGGGVRTLGALR